MKFLNRLTLIAIVSMATSAYFQAMDLVPIAWGVSERQGVRPTMEDAYAHESLELEQGKPKAHYFGIFDGHGGSQSANYAGENAAKEFRESYLNIEEETNPLMQSVYTHQKEHQENPLEQGVYIAHEEDENPLENCMYLAPAQQKEKNPLKQGVYVTSQQNIIQEALEQSYINLDKKMQQQFNDGSAAVSAVIENGKLYLAWAGDARAVVADANGAIKAATVDHKPEADAEKSRIEAAGGIVVYMQTQKTWRINGLAMSRSLGDKMVKKGIKPNIIIANPELITVDKLQKGDIIILACDGLWDVMSNQAAIDFVRDNLSKSVEEIKKLNAFPLVKGESAKNMKNDGSNEKLIEIARALRDTALRRRSMDNISVMILQIQ
jgi:serine/threonine protein phosphatase PrpC